jgi:predicted transcriptional regulator
MVEFTVRIDPELGDTIRRIAAEESAAAKEEISLACIARRALRDYALRREIERRQ